MVNETLIPAGYKKTEVGIIPIDWEVKKLGEMIEKIIGGGTPSREKTEYWGGDVYWATVKDLSKFNPNQTQETINIEGITNSASNLINKRTLITSTRMALGKAVIFNVDVAINQDLKAIYPNKKLDTIYLYYWFERNSLIIEGMGNGSTVKGITIDDLKNIPFITIPLAEQQAIAAVLSYVDALITALDRLIEKKRNIKQGAMQQLLTGQKRLPGFTGKWEMINIIDHSILKARIGWQGLTTKEYLEDGEFYLITGTDFEGGRINWDNCYFVDENRFQQDKNIQLREHDILITKDGTIGKIAYVDKLPGKATLNSGIFVIRPKGNTYHPLFLFYLLKSEYFNLFLSQLKAGSTITHLYQKDFINFRFSAPSLKEQEAIAQVLSGMDAEIEALEKQRDKYKAVKNGMMHQLLTGKIRLG